MRLSLDGSCIHRVVRWQPTHHDVSPLVWWIHCLLTPLKWLVWRLVELIFAWQFRLEGEMRPTTRIEIDVFTGGQILTYEARDMIRSGALTARKGAIARYTSDGVELATEGRSIGADLVVYGTGFVKCYDYLDADVQAKLQLRRDGLYLYRSLLPVSVPGIAFLGSEVSTLCVASPRTAGHRAGGQPRCRPHR